MWNVYWGYPLRVFVYSLSLWIECHLDLPFDLRMPVNKEKKKMFLKLLNPLFESQFLNHFMQQISLNFFQYLGCIFKLFSCFFLNAILFCFFLRTSLLGRHLHWIELLLFLFIFSTKQFIMISVSSKESTVLLLPWLVSLFWFSLFVS